MNNILLKRATLKNIKEVTALEKLASSRTYSGRTTEDEVKNFIKNQFVFLIMYQEKVVGLVAYKITKKTVHFNGLVINPKFRRLGFAKQTLLLVLRKVSQYPRIELVVHPHNNPALALYLSLNFIIDSWKNNYFGDGEPRLMLIKK